MTRKKKILLALTFSLLPVFAGIVWHVRPHGGHTHLAPAGGPAEAQAAEQKYTCGMHPFIIQDEPGYCPICSMALTPVKSGTADKAAKPAGERKIKYWKAPMDPTYIRDKPGKSPMGMDLVPVYEDEGGGGSVITIDPVTRQNMGVRVEPVTRRDLKRTIRTVGLVGYEEARQYTVNTKIDGWIERLHVNETGIAVKKGQPLLSIYSPELVAAQEEFLLALRNKEALAGSSLPEIAMGAGRLLESSRKRLKYWDISERQIARLERTQKAMKTLTLYAPYNGIVTRKNVSEGMYAKAGMELFQLSDISQVWVYADIYEYELPWVKAGQDAWVQLPYRREPLKGTVSTIYPYVEQKTRTVKARIDLANPDLELKPDMYVNVRFEAQVVKDVLTIPAEAVLNSGDKQTVFVALGEGKFEPRRIKPGLQDEEGHLEVVQGLLPHEKVVTSAQFMLDSESRLREAIRKMLAPKKNESAPAPEEESLEDLFADEQEEEDIEALFE